MTQNSNLSINNNHRVNKTDFTLSSPGNSNTYYSNYAQSVTDKLKEVELLLNLGPILGDKDKQQIRRIVKKMYTGLSNY
jgi:hypothetical protein